MKRPHILFLARWYPDRYDPMLGLFVRKHALAVARKFEVSVVYVMADARMKSGTREVVVEKHDGLHEVHIYFGKSRYAFMNSWQYFRGYLTGIKQCPPAQLIHVHVLTRAGVAALYMKWVHRIPYVITEHWSRYLPVNLAKGAFPGWLRKRITRMVVRGARSVTTVTQNLAEAMQALGLNNRYVVVPNVVDTVAFTPVSIPESKATHFVHISCFDEPAKNVKGLLDATRALAQLRSDFTLTLVGDGVDFNDVQRYAQSLQLPEGLVTFTGLLEGDALISQLQQADALVMFSNYENLPCTILEAMACGVPVISTDVGGIREHVSNPFGVLIAKGDGKALLQAMNGVADGSLTFDRQAMRTYAVEQFSMDAVCKKFTEVYALAGVNPE